MSLSARSYLYVPGDRPAMMAKAPTRGADALIIDLEDSVAPEARHRARHEVSTWLDTLKPGELELWVRVNAAGLHAEPDGDDLVVVAHPAVTGIVQAKCEGPETLERLDEALAVAEQRAGLAVGRLAVVPLIETARGVQAMASIAAGPRVRRLQAGEADLVASLGMDSGPNGAELAGLRWTLVITSAAAGIEPPVGPVETKLADIGALRVSTETLRRQGFAGRAALHPRQVPVINAVFTPSAAEVERAMALVERFDTAAANGTGVIVDDSGRMIDQAVVRAARRVLERREYLERQVP